MASQIRKLLKKFIVLSISFHVYTLAGAYLFIYVEDCLPGKRTTVIDENFLHYVKERSDLNEDDKIKVINVTTSYQMNMDERECSYQLPNVLKWWEFTIVTCATIGKILISISHDITSLKGMFQPACLASSNSWLALMLPLLLWPMKLTTTKAN